MEPMDTHTSDIWPTFEDYWNTYNKKVGKVAATKIWNKMSQADKEACMAAIPAYRASRERQYMKDPERYLKHRTWEDEIIVSQKSKHQSTEGYVHSSAEALARKLADREG